MFPFFFFALFLHYLFIYYYGYLFFSFWLKNYKMPQKYYCPFLCLKEFFFFFKKGKHATLTFPPFTILLYALHSFATMNKVVRLWLFNGMPFFSSFFFFNYYYF